MSTSCTVLQNPPTGSWSVPKYSPLALVYIFYLYNVIQANIFCESHTRLNMKFQAFYEDDTHLLSKCPSGLMGRVYMLAYAYAYVCVCMYVVCVNSYVYNNDTSNWWVSWRLNKYSYVYHFLFFCLTVMLTWWVITTFFRQPHSETMPSSSQHFRFPQIQPRP